MQSAKGVKIIHKKKSDGKIEGKTTANRRKRTHTKDDNGNAGGWRARFSW